MPTIRTPRRSIRAIICLIAGLAMLAAAAEGARRRGPVQSGPFDYYLLSLSWSPDFCAAPGGNKDPRECGPGRRLGFVVHGLWPQAEAGRGPENCGGVPPVSESIVSLMRNYIPVPGLVQHEWSTHGSCTGLSASEYFALVRQGRDKVKIPADLAAPNQDRNMAPSQLVADFAGANPSFPAASFTTTCVRGDLEVHVCFTKNLTPRPCSSSAGRCPAPNILLRRPQ